MSEFILVHSELSDEELEKRKYVFPEERKFPLPDKAHVLSAIKFFNYVDPSKEKILANAILRRMKEYGMTNVNVGEDNRFSKYYHPKDTIRHSAKGQTWKNHKYIEIKNGRYIYTKTKDKNNSKHSLHASQQRLEQGANIIIQQERLKKYPKIIQYVFKLMKKMRMSTRRLAVKGQQIIINILSNTYLSK